ncbi:MAG: biotin synthase BioB [Thermoproteota archaeon]|nr:biotin synthase BioB [Thermoproteota archaeon]
MNGANKELIYEKMSKVLENQTINFNDAFELIQSSDIFTLSECANQITRAFNEDFVDVETLINAKSGRCPEDCSFCAQSSFYDTNIDKYPLLSPEEILNQAVKAKEVGANSFCIVCAYRYPPERDFKLICDAIRLVKEKVDIDVNTSLGFMTLNRAKILKSLGVKRYNHNLEAAKSYFNKICTTHSFEDRINTAKVVKEAGLELCSGGIIGMGETIEQRLELGLALQSINPEEVPINILIGKQGTPMFNFNFITTEEIIRTIAVFRFLMPKTIIKIAGGREIHLKDKDRTVLKAGANGIITGGYLTTKGNKAHDDIEMIKEIGLRSN